jgi:hypothetical protein
VISMFGNAAASSSSHTPGADSTSNPSTDPSFGTTDLSDWTIDPPSEKALDLVFVGILSLYRGRQTC